MQKQLKRTLTLLLLLALLLGIVPTGSAFRAYAAETETVAAETEETTEVSAAAEEPTPEFEEETGPCEEPIPEEESKPAEENEAPREIDPGEGEATGTIVELEQIQPRDEVLASSYGLQIPVILYGAGNAFTVSFRYPNDTSQTTYNIKLTGFRYHYLNGQMAYCLEPQAESTPSAVYSQIAGGSELNVWERYLSISQRNAIALALAYGAPNTLTSPNNLTLHGYEAATQIIIWELIIGYRDTVAPFSRTNSGLYDFVLNLCNPNDNTGTLRAAYISGYNAIVSSMQNHGVIPSFASKKQAQAPEHEMTYDVSTGLYKVVLTDTNNAINNDFPYASGNGLTFSKSGNKLTITATAAAMQQPVLVQSTGSDPDTDNISPVIWGTTNSNHKLGQILSQMAAPDPVNVYFKLTANTTTNLSIQKTCVDGKVGGITFTVTDSSGNVLFSGQTDPSGKLNVPDLEIGSTVTVTETVPDNYVAENRTQTVTLKAGDNTVTFRNIPLGTAALNKVSEGGDVEGYCFNLYRFKNGSTSDRTWRGKSGADGRVYETDGSYNAIGTEKNYLFKGLTDGTYAFREVLSLHGAGNVWPESITFATSGGTTPACTLIFSGEQLVSHENGDCTVSGIALTGLDGGGTLTITIKNEPVYISEGEITVRKVNEKGQPLSGVTFLLEYSTDNGGSWNAVTSRGEDEPVALGGCTSAGLTHGKLITGGDGLACFNGLCVETDEGPVLYRLTETATLPGYSLLSAPAFEGSLPESEDFVVTLTAVNMPEYQLPITGGHGFAATVFGVTTALLCTAALLMLLRKKTKPMN